MLSILWICFSTFVHLLCYTIQRCKSSYIMYDVLTNLTLAWMSDLTDGFEANGDYQEGGELGWQLHKYVKTN